MRKTRVSVVIVTKNRVVDLKHCLGSLLSQTDLPDEIVVVDNDSTDGTAQVVENIATTTKGISVRYVKETNKGYPVIYNRGLLEAKYEWVAFIDDDCVANTDWLKKAKETLSVRFSVVMGYSDTYFRSNIFSLATLFFDSIWKERGSKRKEVVNFSILDNKNIIYNAQFLSEHKLSYDEKRQLFNGAAEDSDLGLAIQKAGGKALYIKEMIVKHKDPQRVDAYLKKIFFSNQASKTLFFKWDKELITKNVYAISSFVYFKQFVKSKKISVFKTYCLLLVLVCTSLFNKACSR